MPIRTLPSRAIADASIQAVDIASNSISKAKIDADTRLGLQNDSIILDGTDGAGANKGDFLTQSVIKSVQVDQFTDLPDKSPKREQRYSVTPEPVSAEFDDNFGFNETTSFFQDAKDYNPETGSDE